MPSGRSEILAAIQRYGPTVNAIAAQYTNPVTGQKLSGRALLAKLLQGESGALSDPGGARTATSSAGAKGWGQFMPGSRQEAIKKYGLDPWASPDEAVHATALHLRGKINGSTGLEGYNPGDPSYTGYILGQKVGDLGGGKSAGRSAGSPTPPPVPSTAPTSQPWDTSSGGPGLADLLGQLQADRKPTPTQSIGVAPPSFTATPALPQGYQPVSASSPPATKGNDLASLLAGIAAPAGDGVGPSAPIAQATPQTSPAPSRQAPPPRTAGGPITDVKRLLSRAAAIDSQHLPYVYGGGHGAKASKPGTPLDCSSAVSKVLGIDPRVSGDFERFGSPGRAPEGGVTIYANKGHVLMEINGRFWGTSRSNPNGGAGWIDKSQISPEYLKGFTARHLAGAR